MVDTPSNDHKLDLNTEVALLTQFNAEVVKPALIEIKEELKKQNLSYVPRNEFDDFKKDTEKQFQDVKKHGILKNILIAIATAVATLVITYMVNDILGRR